MKNLLKALLILSLSTQYSCIVNKPITSKVAYPYFDKVKLNIKINSIEEPDVSINNSGDGFIFWKNKGRNISKLKISEDDILLPEDTEKIFISINDSGNGLLLLNSKVYQSDNKSYRSISYQKIQSYNLSSENRFLLKKEINNDSIYSVLDIDKNGDGIVLLSSDNENFNYFNVKGFDIDQNLLKKAKDENYPFFILSKNLQSNGDVSRKIIKLDQNKNGFVTNTVDDPIEIRNISRLDAEKRGFIGTRIDNDLSNYRIPLNYITYISDNKLKEKKYFDPIYALRLLDSSDIAIDKNGNSLVIYNMDSEYSTLNITGSKNYNNNNGYVFDIQNTLNKIHKPRVYLNDNSEGFATWQEVSPKDKSNISLYFMPIKKDSVVFLKDYSLNVGQSVISGS